jgi:SOS response regulatory protein OraA/RecX
MSKIAEKRTDEIVGEFHDGDYTDHSRHNTQWVAFKQGYDQAMQDFLEWLKGAPRVDKERIERVKSLRNEINEIITEENKKKGGF